MAPLVCGSGTAAKFDTADAGFISVFVATAAPAVFGGKFVSVAITVTVRSVLGARSLMSAEVAEEDSNCSFTTTPSPFVTSRVSPERATSLAGMVQVTWIEDLVTCETARFVTALNEGVAAPAVTAVPIVIELAAIITAIA